MYDEFVIKFVHNKIRIRKEQTAHKIENVPFKNQLIIEVDYQAYMLVNLSLIIQREITRVILQ